MFPLHNIVFIQAKMITVLKLNISSRLYQKYQDDTTEGVLYRMLLHSLGVADLPKDLTAMVTSSRGIQEKEEKRQPKLFERY